jgi:hypothetical protein
MIHINNNEKSLDIYMGLLPVILMGDNGYRNGSAEAKAAL